MAAAFVSIWPLLLVGAFLLQTEVNAVTIVVVASCRHDIEFSKSVAYNLANKDVNNYFFVTDEKCAETVKIPNVEVFSTESWLNESLQTTGVGLLTRHSNEVQNRMDEVVRSAETLQRLLERESVQLVIADSYSTCAAAVAETHDIPVILMHNSGFPQATANQVRVEYSFIPNVFYSFAPDFLKVFIHELIVVMFKNLPDVRMAVSIGNKCNMDLKTNISHANLLHLWSSYPRIGSFLPPFLEYNKKTKHFLPLGQTDLIEKGKPKSNRLENFMKASVSESSGDSGVENFAYFTGEEVLIHKLGWEYFHDAFTQEPDFKTIWTNGSLPEIPTNKQILITPMTIHSIMTEKAVMVIVGTCSLDNLLIAMYYQRILVCFDVYWRESALARSIEKSRVGITLWPFFTTTNGLKSALKTAFERKDEFGKQISDVRKHQTSKIKALKDLVFELTELPSSSFKKRAIDPVNHKIELGFIIVTFLMFLRFFIKSGRRVFAPTVKKVKVAIDENQKSEESKKTK